VGRSVYSDSERAFTQPEGGEKKIPEKKKKKKRRGGAGPRGEGSLPLPYLFIDEKGKRKKKNEKKKKKKGGKKRCGCATSRPASSWPWSRRGMERKGDRERRAEQAADIFSRAAGEGRKKKAQKRKGNGVHHDLSNLTASSLRIEKKGKKKSLSEGKGRKRGKNHAISAIRLNSVKKRERRGGEEKISS